MVDFYFEKKTTFHKKTKKKLFFQKIGKNPYKNRFRFLILKLFFEDNMHLKKVGYDGENTYFVELNILILSKKINLRFFRIFFRSLKKYFDKYLQKLGSN